MMIKKAKLILIFVATSVIAFSQNTARNNSNNEIEDYFNDIVSKNKIGGVTVLISQNSKISYQKSFGFIDKEKNIPMINDAIVPIASMTKIITTIAVLQLHEQGLFLLDDPIEKYIPELGEVKVASEPFQNLSDSIKTETLKNKLTIRDFLRHTSGMTYYGGKTVTDRLYAESGFKKWDKSLKEFVIKVGGIPLAFHPNEGWDYGLSHDILGYLVEVVSKTSLEQYCHENIFSPLEMVSAGFYVANKNKAYLTSLYRFKNDELTLSINRENSKYLQKPPNFSGGGGWADSYGGIVCSANDFHNVCLMLLNYGTFKEKQILKHSTIKSMISNQIGEFDSYGNKYGLGVGVILSDSNELTKEIFWAGAPYNTYFRIDYIEKTIGIMFPNTAPFGHLGMMDKFKELMTGRELSK